MTGKEPWAFDFFSHIDRVKDYCEAHRIVYRAANQRCLVLPAPQLPQAEALVVRFENETFGVRAGGSLESGDAILEGELARRGVDAYHKSFPGYFFCAVCGFEDGSLVLLSEKLWASEVTARAPRSKTWMSKSACQREATQALENVSAKIRTSGQTAFPSDLARWK